MLILFEINMPDDNNKIQQPSTETQDCSVSAADNKESINKLHDAFKKLKIMIQLIFFTAYKLKWDDKRGKYELYDAGFDFDKFNLSTELFPRQKKEAYYQYLDINPESKKRTRKILKELILRWGLYIEEAPSIKDISKKEQS
jgi:hypothetical protein